MKHQQTISSEAELEGRGLFTGEPVKMRLKPAASNSGIWFVLSDQSPPVRIAANVDHISKRARRTSLKNGTAAIETVEHCLSACHGLGIDNLEIELIGSELPACDGSSLPFVERLQQARITEQEAVRDPFVITDMVRVVEGDCELVALPPLDPGDTFLEISYDLEYGPDTPIGRQRFDVRVTPETFVKEIAPARTFVLEHEAEQLRKSGLGTHLSYEDVLVFGKDGPINNALRFTNECVRHKVLDLLGDLMLLGRFLIGRIFARKSGHSLNHLLVRVLQAQAQEQQQRLFLTQRPTFDIHHVQRILPHRYPLLMVDRILEIEGTSRAVALKNVTVNEAFFQGHYPGNPIMPGVLVIEALAQVGGILLSQDLEHKGKVAVLLSLDKVKFRRAVRPGDQLILEARSVRVRTSTGHVKGEARVAGEMVAEADIKFMLTDAEAP